MRALRARLAEPSHLPVGSLGWGIVGVALAAVAVPGLVLRPSLVLLVAATAAWVLLLGSTARVERSFTFVLLAGAMVLGYGFANVGFRSGMPLPLADAVLILLVVAALVGRPDWRAPMRIMLPVCAFLGIVLVRLWFDVPVWHSNAVRDSTTALEALAVLVGYRAVSRDGISAWVRRFEVIFVAVLAYGSLQPWNDWLASHGPTVGLQRNVSLLGSGALSQSVSIVAAFAFFAVYTTGTRRIVLMAWAMGVLALVQSRGLYIALGLCIVVLGWSLRRHAGTWLRVAMALAFAALLLSVAAGAGISGRLGHLSPDFYVKHVETLGGDSGPGAKSYHDRTVWMRKTLHAMTETRTTEAVGVGLGPDLAFGFSYLNGVSVRKPHDDFLEVLARTGVVGFTVFLFMLWQLIAPTARRARRSEDEEGRFCAFVLATAVAYLAVAATQPLLAFSYGTLPLFILLGMSSAVVYRTTRNPSDQERRDPHAPAG